MDMPILHVRIDDDGIPRTVNKRVKVTMIAQKHYLAQESIEAIAEHYSISAADVHAALAYYHDNHAEFERQAHERQPLIEAARRRSDTLKAKILQHSPADPAE